MGTVRKIGNEYYIEFYARGLLYQQKAGTDKDAAERMLKDVEDKIQKGEMDVLVRDVDTDIFFKTYLEHCRNEFDPKSFQRYASVVRHFKEFCAGELSDKKKLSEVTPGVIENYRVDLIQNSGQKPKAINFTLLLLKNILDHAIRLGYLNDNPALHVRWAEIKEPAKPLFLTDQEIEQLLECAGDDLQDIVTMALNTGIRISEMIALAWTKVDFKDKTIRIDAIQNAGGQALRERVIPLDYQGEAVLRRFQIKNATGPGIVFVGDDGKPFEERRLKEELKQAGAKARLEDTVTFDVLRNTSARNILNRGVSLVDLYRLLGLSDIAKVMRFSVFARDKK